MSIDWTAEPRVSLESEIVRLNARIAELEGERELVGRLVAEGNKLIEKMTAENAELRMRLVRAKELCDLIVNSPPSTLIKGRIESLAFELSHCLLNISAPSSKREELRDAVISTALHFRRSHKRNEELALHEFNVMTDAIDALDAEESTIEPLKPTKISSSKREELRDAVISIARQWRDELDQIGSPGLSDDIIRALDALDAEEGK